MNLPYKSTSLLLILGLLAVAITVAARKPIAEQAGETPSLQPLAARTPPPSPEEIAAPHLQWARRECDRIIQDHIEVIDRFFANAMVNARPFADEALSWSGKWPLIVDHVPFTEGGRQQRFIRARFEEYFFKPAQLEQVVRQAVAEYLKHMDSIEGQMLVRIRADAADFPSAFLIARTRESDLKVTYDQALVRAMDATGGELRADIATQVVSVITSEVLTQVAVRLGVSAGIIGTGAASSWATFGIGLAVGLIVDQVVSWVWDWYADPKGDLAVELKQKLYEIHRLIVYGSNDVKGLRNHLRAFADARAEMRSQAVRALLQPN